MRSANGSRSAPTSEPPAPAGAPRIAAIDRLRGLIMLLMALDHTRDFFVGLLPSPTDLAVTTPALFATRWITHICAPGFLLLAGISAWLHGRRVGRAALARYLLTRGFMLIVLELTLVSFFWIPVPDHSVILLQVLWAIGWSMVLLAPLVFLPVEVVGCLGLVLMALNPIAARIVAPEWLDVLALTANATLHLGGLQFIVSYPVLPWTGVMLAGYGLGPLIAGGRWRRTALLLGLAATAAFLVLRAVNLPGADPVPWRPGEGAVWSAMAFLNAEKYPPSPLFLLMTLGPVLILLALLDRARPSQPLEVLETFGRAPLFFYVLHLGVLRMVGIGAAAAVWGLAALGPPPAPSTPEIPLWATWLVWLAALAAFYRPVRWFARLRGRRGGWTAWV